MGKQKYFIGLGVQKAATSWLAEYFRRHPDVLMSKPKELHFFDSKYTVFNLGYSRGTYHGGLIKYYLALLKSILGDSDRSFGSMLLGFADAWRMIHGSESAYLRFVSKRRVGNIIAGEMTPAYSALNSEGYARLEAMLSGPQYILILRNPADRLFSNIAHDLSRGRLTSAELSAASLEVVYSDPIHGLKSRSDYCEILQNLDNLEAQKRTIVVFYESLFDPILGAGEVKKLCEFMGISFVKPDFKRAVNQADKSATALAEIMVNREALLSLLEDQYRFCLKKFGNDLPKNWLDDCARLGFVR